MIAPEPILKAGLDTLHCVLVSCRNWSLNSETPVKRINDITEAAHEIPLMLSHWDESRLAELKLHLSEFPFEQWRSLDDKNSFIPNLVDWFEQKLLQYESER